MRDPSQADLVNEINKIHNIPKGVISAVMSAWMQLAAKRMLLDGKQIDFGIFKISAVPYRENWREILLSKDPKVGVSLSGSKEERVDRVYSRVQEELTCTDLLDWDTFNNQIRWNLSCVTTDEWKKFSTAFEKEIKKRCETKSNYVGRLQKAVKSTARSIVQAFFSYVQKVSHPSASVSKCSNRRGDYALVPFFKPKAATPSSETNPHLGKVNIVYPTEIPAFKDSGRSSSSVEAAADALLEVLNFQFSEENVRGDGGED